MDSFGFDFPGGDLLDLGSLGMWGGNSTPLGSSPNGGTNGGLPFSVGTPTGVQSLGDEPFSSLSGGADDFNFGESPKETLGARAKQGTADDLTSPYFGSELDPGGSEQSSENNTGNNGKPDDVKEQPGAQRKSGNDASAAGNAANASSGAPGNNNSASSNQNGAAGFMMADPNNMAGQRPNGAFQNNNNNNNAKAGAGAAAARNAAAAATSASAASTASSSTSSTPASTNASSARPHIDGPGSAAPSPSGRASVSQQQQSQQQQHQQAMAQQQQRYPNQMMMNPGMQQPGQPNFVGQGYQLNAQGNPIVGGPQQAPVNGQYMQPQYRAPTSSYDEEFMRVKAMMMQHPDLIPPPMEVLRISMSQSAPNPAMMGPGGNYMQQRPGQVMNRAGGYPQYGAPNMMMPPQPQQPGMDANRMRAMQQQAQQAQQAQQRQMPQGARTPGGSSSGSPENQAAWQSENDLPLRRKMIGKMYVLLSADALLRVQTNTLTDARLWLLCV